MGGVGWAVPTFWDWWAQPTLLLLPPPAKNLPEHSCHQPKHKYENVKGYSNSVKGLVIALKNGNYSGRIPIIHSSHPFLGKQDHSHRQAYTKKDKQYLQEY